LWNADNYDSVIDARKDEATYVLDYSDLSEADLPLITEVARAAGAILNGDEGAIWVTEVYEDG